MKTTTLTLALLLSASLLSAQTGKKASATVHIKKVERINGVDKIIDTTYTTDDVTTLKLEDESALIQEVSGKDGKTKRMVVVQSTGGGSYVSNEERDGDVVVRSIVESSDEKTGAKTMTIRITRKAHICEASDSELKQLGRSTGTVDNKLDVEDMNFYPNPNNGKFNLKFSLKQKGAVEVSIISVDGKAIYSERLSDFSGSYDKEIDISRQPKGIYFVKVSQNGHAQLKKIVLE